MPLFQIPCFPLMSLLDALRQRRIDYLSLHLAGAELAVLKTVDFTKVDVKVLTVEYSHVVSTRDLDTRTLTSYVNSNATNLRLFQQLRARERKPDIYTTVLMFADTKLLKMNNINYLK